MNAVWRFGERTQPVVFEVMATSAADGSKHRLTVCSLLPISNDFDLIYNLHHAVKLANGY